MKLGSMDDLFKMELQDLYSAEQMILKALPKMSKATSSSELRDAFQQHFEETKHQVERLEQIFETIGESPKAHKCKAMQGIIEEGEEVLKESAEESVKDAALIGAAQRVEHYEMAAYGCLRTYAHLLGNRQAASLAEKTLDEEKRADKKLTDLAEGLVNPQAAEGEGHARRKAA
jgi:ferritin-like metal-binding protein YciE